MRSPVISWCCSPDVPAHRAVPVLWRPLACTLSRLCAARMEPRALIIEFPRRLIPGLLRPGRGLPGLLLSLSLACAAAHASVYALPDDGSTVIGEDARMTTAYEDTLPDLVRGRHARVFE